MSSTLKVGRIRRGACRVAQEPWEGHVAPLLEAGPLANLEEGDHCSSRMTGGASIGTIGGFIRSIRERSIPSSSTSHFQNGRIER